MATTALPSVSPNRCEAHKWLPPTSAAQPTGYPRNSGLSVAAQRTFPIGTWPTILTLVALAVVACGEPLPSAVEQVVEAGSPSANVTPGPSDGSSAGTPPSAPRGSADSPQPPPTGLPSLVTEASLAVPRVVALASSADGAWYISTGARSRVGWLSRLGVERSGPVGPAPVAIAASASQVYVAEGIPETGHHDQPRTGVLERVDGGSFRVKASVPVSGTVTAIAHIDGLVWTIDTQGTIAAYDDRTLVRMWTDSIGGRGPASIAAGDDAIWAAIGDVSESDGGQYLVARVSLSAGHTVLSRSVPGDGIGPVIAADARAWLAIADDPVHDWLYPIASDGGLGTPTYLPAPAGMTSTSGWLWWVGVDGSAGVVNESTGARSPDFSMASGSGAAIAADGTTAFISAGDRVSVLSLPVRLNP